LNKIILTDVDGVLLDWEAHFTKWAANRGYEPIPGYEHLYRMRERYGFEGEVGDQMVAEFNNSAWTRSHPPLRDAQQGVARLVDQGYKFHAVTSLSRDPYAKKAREENLQELFGDVFVQLDCLDTGAAKTEELYELKLKYPQGTYWLEDNVKNVDDGIAVGFQGILVGHRFNQNYQGEASRVDTWAEIVDIILG
jgi:FMN phosphatase YigB (HAD superfamily)